MGRMQATARVKCPICGERAFDVFPGSECFCECGAAFRIVLTGRSYQVKLARDPVSWNRGKETGVRRPGN
ncbi:MAG TPA: hypothetical protein PLP42_18480 [Acidobacteriota bacterium]|nr:hypothetical protein [Acidobacteriota bacterium]